MPALNSFQLSVLTRLANSGYPTEAESARQAWLAGQSYTLPAAIGGTSRLRLDFETANREATKRPTG